MRDVAAMKNIGEIIKYIRNNILKRETEEMEGDDLRIDIYDNEISFCVNDLYDGPIVTYNMRINKMWVTFHNTRGIVDEKYMEIEDVEQVVVAAQILELIQKEKEVINKFLKGE